MAYLRPLPTLALAASVAACGATAPSATAPPVLVMAETTAQRQFGLIAGGDWGAAWDMWTPSAQALISRDQVIRLHAACPVRLGVAYTVDARTLAAPDTATIAWHRGAETGTTTLRLVDGVWQVEPDAALRAELALGADEALALRRAAGLCP